jgi:hypothetical protein
LNLEEVTSFLFARNGERTLFVYGHVDYVDAFGKKRETPFCLQYDPSPGAGLDPFAVTGDHNTPKDY